MHQGTSWFITFGVDENEGQAKHLLDGAEQKRCRMSSGCQKERSRRPSPYEMNERLSHQLPSYVFVSRIALSRVPKQVLAQLGANRALLVESLSGLSLQLQQAMAMATVLGVACGLGSVSCAGSNIAFSQILCVYRLSRSSCCDFCPE